MLIAYCPVLKNIFKNRRFFVRLYHAKKKGKVKTRKK